MIQNLLDILETDYRVPLHLLDILAEEFKALERENRALQDDLAMLHTLATDSYERRRASKYKRD